MDESNIFEQTRPHGVECIDLYQINSGESFQSLESPYVDECYPGDEVFELVVRRQRWIRLRLFEKGSEPSVT